MKIITNIKDSKIGGIGRVTSSFAQWVNQHAHHEPIELVGVSAEPRTSDDAVPSEVTSTRSRQEGMDLISHLVLPSKPLGDVLKESADLRDVKRHFRAGIEAFRTSIREEKPDLVLLNGTYYLPWLLMNAAHAEKVPMALHYHGSLTKETEHWNDEHMKNMMRAMESSFDRKGMRYIFPSTLAKTLVENKIFNHRLSNRRAIVLPNSVPDEFFNADPVMSKGQLGFVGRWTKIKNTEFIERLAKYNDVLEQPFRLNIITDPTRKQFARESMQGASVRLLNPRDNAADLARFYAQMSYMLCPSYFETYGNVAQEAVAAGTPAFVSKNMGVAEVFRKIGLDRLVVDFKTPRNFFKVLDDNHDLRVITDSHRMALRDMVGSDVIHQRFA